MTRITLRHATPEDWPSIVRLHREHQAAQGTDYELPDLFGPAIALALAAVDESGEIRACIYAEAIAEMCFVGCDPKITAVCRREIEGFAYALRRSGFRFIKCFVPRKLKEAIGRPLARAGFFCADGELSHFVRDLRPQ
jgi:hypothetical protein